MSNFLVIDFDYFFPNPMDGGDYETAGGLTYLYDWGHVENPLHIDGGLWSSRLHAFHHNGLPLPYVEPPEGGWGAWWERFTIEEDAPLLICDSNGHAGNERASGGGPFDSVWLYDAHHDSGYRPDAWPPGDTFQCEDWMLQHAEAGTDPAELHVRYPTWRLHALTGEPEPPLPIDRVFDDGTSPPVSFELVLLCRSGAWVPPWCDWQFMELVGAWPGDVEQVDDVGLVRAFDVEAETAVAAEINTWLRAQGVDVPEVKR